MKNLIKKILKEEAHKRLLREQDDKPPMVWNKCSSDVKNHNGPILLMFGRDYCGPCKKLKKIMETESKFNEWAHDNNVVGLYLDCEVKHWTKDDPKGCRTKKCSDGRTYQEDLGDTTWKFGGAIGGSGMKRYDGRWQGVPKIFITDSSFEKQNKVKFNDYNIDNMVNSLNSAL